MGQGLLHDLLEAHDCPHLHVRSNLLLDARREIGSLHFDVRLKKNEICSLHFDVCLKKKTILSMRPFELRRKLMKLAAKCLL